MAMSDPHYIIKESYVTEEGEMATDGLEMRLEKAKQKRPKQDPNMGQQRAVPRSNESMQTGDTEALTEDRDEAATAAPRRSRSTSERERDDSTTSLYEGWIKWMVENDYAKSEEQVKDFMGIRPRPQRHYALEGDVTRSPCIQSKTCLPSPWASHSITGEEARDIPDDCLPTSMQRILDKDGGESSASCLGDPWGARSQRLKNENGSPKSCLEAPWLAKDSTSQPSDEQLDASRRRLSKLSASLGSIRCIVGSPRDIQDGNESIATGHDKYEAVEQEAQDDQPISRKNRRVAFLADLIDQSQQAPPPKRWRELEQERIKRDLEKLQKELEELQLIHCLSDTDLWMNMHYELRESKKRDDAVFGKRPARRQPIRHRSYEM